MARCVLEDGLWGGKPDGTGEKLPHHALLRSAGLGEAALQRGDLHVRVGVHARSCLLLRERWARDPSASLLESAQLDAANLLMAGELRALDHEPPSLGEKLLQFLRLHQPPAPGP